MSGDMLTVRGEKCYQEKEKDRDVSERAYGSFQRRFTSPETIGREKIAPI